MSARDKISCFDCNARIILKNLKVHYQRFHPSKPVKHRSLNEKCVDKLFSNLKRKAEEENADQISSKESRKSEEENDDEISSKKLDIASTTPLEEHFANSSTAVTNNSHDSLHENNVSSVLVNNNQNEDSVSVNKDILNKILMSIQGKNFSYVLF